ncbi:RES family NAD+ phosphorylase [Nitrosovibrio sp. Nv6]|uniref:RES family NAD+ phosphorylase n=1 Tax=Nitrosovibrio sp. Nv6 TaxID=1855340 RepID=UPI0008C739DB|nr:RES family NAD+ phosphorylase [Nitrosovibrio sp. Nv6]SEO58998.1 RES domain-containing protein [Nitrosovibrio sp. Nv6]
MTVLLWRIGTDTPDYGADDMSGEGARRTGGRWNRPGTPMIYASRSIALACLETIVHLAAGDLPLNRYLVSVEIPDDVWKTATILEPKDHVSWDAIPAGLTSLQAGNQWATARISALLLAPSVIVPEENNVLINPAHPAAARIKAKKLRRWAYDARLR